MMTGRRHKQVSQAESFGLRMVVRSPSWGSACSGNPKSMGLLCLLKGCGLVQLLLLPNGVHNARPDVGQGSDSDALAFALSPFALRILFRPGFLESTLPGELMQDIAPGLDAAQPAMRLLGRPALKEDRGGTRKGLQAACAVIVVTVIAHFGQQSRSETGSSSRQRLQELAVGMAQKKALDLLVRVGNLLEKRLQLVSQGQHQPRFGACRHLGGMQTRLLEMLGECLGFLSGSRISGLLEESGQFLHRGSASCLQSGIDVQKRQSRGLLHLAKQLQSDRVIRFEASRELIDQAGLHVDQSVLITCQGFALLDRFAVRIEPTQIREVSTPGFGQQVSISQIGFSPTGSWSSLSRPRIHRVDRPSLLQQMSNQVE